MVELRLITVLGDLFLGEDSPIKPEGKKKRETLGSRLSPPDFTWLLKTMSVLVRCCTTNATTTASPPPSSLIVTGGVIPVSESDKTVILCKDMYGNGLSLGHNPNALGEIIGHWCYEDREISDKIVDVVVNGVESSRYTDAKTYFDVMRHLVH